METWRHGDMETWRHGDMEMKTWKHGDVDMETCARIYGDIKRKRKLRRFSLTVYCLLNVQQKFEVCPFVNEETNRNYPFAIGRNRLKGLAHL